MAQTLCRVQIYSKRSALANVTTYQAGLDSIILCRFDGIFRFRKKPPVKWQLLGPKNLLHGLAVLTTKLFLNVMLLPTSSYDCHCSWHRLHGSFDYRLLPGEEEPDLPACSFLCRVDLRMSPIMDKVDGWPVKSFAPWEKLSAPKPCRNKSTSALRDAVRTRTRMTNNFEGKALLISFEV